MTELPCDRSAAAAGDHPSASDRYGQALEYLYDRIDYERMAKVTSRYPFRLQRITELLVRLGLERYLDSYCSAPPVPLVHIAGTKGKGSTAAMVAAMLSASGLRTGLYTSPHLHELQERFRIDAHPCSRDEIVALVDQIGPLAETMASEPVGAPSFFDLTTAMALLHFDQQRCDAIVLEVGLGGRLDSTNVCAPSVTAITSIGRDHQHILGDTPAKIAAEKAGIIKPGIPVVSGVTATESGQVIAQQARRQGAPLYQLGGDFSYRSEPKADWGSSLEFRGETSPLSRHVVVDVNLEGEHQAQNASLAVAMIDLLGDRTLGIDASAAHAALATVQCPGRIERFDLGDQVMGIVDTAHNDDSIHALCQCLRRRVAGRPVSVVFGTSRDKSAAPMLSQLAEFTDRLVLTQFESNPRFQPPENLLPMVPESIRPQTQIVAGPVEACRQAHRSIAPGGVLVVCGSFFLAAETRPWLASQASEC